MISSSSPRPVVSILVVNYNGAPLLEACLRSIAQLTFPSYEVVVVDNGSTDDSLVVLKSFATVKVVTSGRNLGFAGGNNLGLLYCRGDHVLLLNNDTVVPKGLLEPLVSYVEAHPEVGVIQGKMVLPRFGGTLDVCGSFLTRLGLPYHYGFYKPDGPRYRRSYAVFGGKGACLLFRRDIVGKVGGFLFDEEFFCYYEETDFCHRAWLAGYEVHFVASPPVQHFMGGTADPQSGFAFRLYFRNMLVSLSSNLSPVMRWRIVPPLLLVLVLNMVLAGLRGRKDHCAAYKDALMGFFRDRGRVRRRRAIVDTFRKRNDAEFIPRVLRNPRFDYFLRTARGSLAGYVDEDV